MKLKTLAAAALIAAAAFVGQANAAELKIAVLDSQKVINDTNASKRAVETLKKNRDEAQKKINALEAPLVEKQKKLAEQQKVLAPDKFAEAQTAFQKDVAAFRAQAQTIQEGLEKNGFALRKQITDAVKGVVNKIAAERKYDLVIPKAMAFYTSANVTDITAEVLAQTNAALDK
jgi:outer membrane protein